MLRKLKLLLLRLARGAGLFRLLAASPWRRRRLLVLCYHGVSIDDEHLCFPGLYVRAELLADRLAQLRRGRYNVLPLDEAVRRLRAGTLPPRSVAITFDDGNHDFHARAWPVLRAAGVPATVYLTTYYAEHDHAVFPVAVAYLLWKAPRGEISFPLGAREVTLDTRTTPARQRAKDLLVRHAQDERLSGDEKDALARRLAAALGLDYEATIGRRRLLHIMTPAEVRELAAAGLDIQLHTHRHRSPPDAERYRAEIADNQERIVDWTGRAAHHFCYPSGVCMPQFAGWLAEEGVVSATTCEPGMATATTDPFRLPRLLDHSDLTPLEFEAWLCGLGALLPHRPVGFTPVDRDGNLMLPAIGSAAEGVGQAGVGAGAGMS